jgi:LemA protein
MTPFNISIGILALIFLGIVIVYNGLVKARMRVREAWADIDVQLKRRFDLIPNLVNTVKGSTNFETSTLEKVIQARTVGMTATTTSEIAQADVAMKSALSGFFALAESYPDLKSNMNFIALQNELSDTENKIQSARRFYNSNVMEYNTSIATVPNNMFAKIFGFSASDFFELDEKEQAAKNPVEVKF